MLPVSEWVDGNQGETESGDGKKSSLDKKKTNDLVFTHWGGLGLALGIELDFIRRVETELGLKQNTVHTINIYTRGV